MHTLCLERFDQIEASRHTRRFSRLSRTRVLLGVLGKDVKGRDKRGHDCE
jgi:hypothetical protein